MFNIGRDGLALPDIGTGSGTPVNNATGQACPIKCEEQVVNETWYLSEVASPDAIPITIQETEIKCDEVVKEEEPDIDCEKLLAALRAMGYNVESLNGLAGCNFAKSGNTTVRGLGRIGTLRNGDLDTNASTTLLSIADVKQSLTVNCPEKDFSSVTDSQILAIITDEMTKITNFALTDIALLKGNVSKRVCALGKSKSFIDNMSKEMKWAALLAIVGGGLYFIAK
jgi:hypothetical protein